MNQNNVLIYHDLLAGIITALEARDLYTSTHSLRVSDFSERMCNIMNLSKEKTQEIHIAAHVHDIGKIGIPDAILRKTSSLTDHEWSIMKSHSQIGYDILSRVNGFQQIAKIVLHHHEKWNGQGYPHGLRGENIPFGSRIIAVADSVDAMLSCRSYRNGIGSERCKHEISKNSGIMYDKKIAEIVLEHWDAIIGLEV